MSIHKLPLVCIASVLVGLAACSAGQSSSSDFSSASTSSSTIDQAIDHALDRADAKLSTKNITVSNNDGATGQPKAEITPQGDFLIEGKPVALTPAQRTEMLAYRKQLVEIARQGIAIGKQGATLGMNAAGAAIAGVFSGESEQQIRQRVEAKASGIRAAAAKICARLPDLMTSQQKLAVDVPAFKPYATMTQNDIDDCRRNSLKDDND